MSAVCFVCSFPVLSHQTPRTWERENQQVGLCHEDCLRCDTCGLTLSGPNLPRARCHRTRFFCDLHYLDIVAIESSDALQQLREFKRHALGCAVARRKSSTTLIFPVPPQACMGSEHCPEYPHRLEQVPGYWTECTMQSAEVPIEKFTTEEIYRSQGTFELTSFEQETFEKYFYATEHWNYFTNDEDLGPVILSLKQEVISNRDQFRILVRTVSYSVHGLVPASCLAADRYNREDVVRSLSNEINLHPPLQLGQLPSTPDELIKLDQVFIKSELKVGVIYVKEGQCTEEDVLENTNHSLLFDEFLQVLGDKVRLKGFDKYRGGLDTIHDLTGKTSVYTYWRGIEIMFHVSTMLPYEKNDPQKLQRKRHVGNDIVCVVFLEAASTNFSPSCIKSHFLHTFIVVQVDPISTESPPVYKISVVSRDEVEAYKPYLCQKYSFTKGPLFREWLLTKIVNGERASYSAPKFARMQDRTRSQLLEDIVTNLQNHAETGQIPKPYRRGSWRPIGHMRPSSPLLDSMRDLFEGYEQLAKDFTKAFKDTNALCDIVFNVGQGKEKVKVYAVRAILAVRSRVFQEMLYGIASGLIGTSQSPLEALNRAVTPTKFSKSSNFLQVPDAYEPSRHKSTPSSPMVMRAFSRLARWDWSGKKQDGHLQVDQDNLRRWTSDINCHDKKDSHQDVALLMPRLSVCADAQKVDRNKLLQSEFNIIEFDPDTFETLLEYLHTGSCPLTCRTIPGLICAAEHFDLPELLQACFHHAKQHLHIEIVCAMLNSLENYYWRYTSASELVNMILLYVDTRSSQVFECSDFYELSESMVQMILSRELSIPEVQKFRTMLEWSRSKSKQSSCRDSNFEFRCTMERLTRDLKLYNISPTDLIKVVLPTKAIRNERILDTLMYQADTGMYRVQPSYIQQCRINMQERRDSRPDMQLYGMYSFDRRDSLVLNDDPEQPDALLAEHMASIRRQQSLNQDMLSSSMQKQQRYKRRSSKPDFRPLLHKQDAKRRGSKQLESILSQGESDLADDRLHARRDSKLYTWLHRQDSKSQEETDEEKKARRPSARRDSKSSDSWLYIWLHRQDSKNNTISQPIMDDQTHPKDDSEECSGFSGEDSSQLQVPSPLMRKLTQKRISKGPKLSEMKLQKRRSSCYIEHIDFDISNLEKKESKRDSIDTDIKSSISTSRGEATTSSCEPKLTVSEAESANKSFEEEKSIGDDNFPHSYPRRNSKSQESRFLSWFSRRDSKTCDSIDDGTNSSHTSATGANSSSDQTRLLQRRNSKLYSWFMRSTVRLQDECN